MFLHSQQFPSLEPWSAEDTVQLDSKHCLLDVPEGARTGFGYQRTSPLSQKALTPRTRKSAFMCLDKP